MVKGAVDVGFEINRREKLVLRFANKIIIGAYNCAFNKKTLFLYKCKTDVYGLQIRKDEWQMLMADFGPISEYFIKSTTKEYMEKIKVKCLQ